MSTQFIGFSKVEAHLLPTIDTKSFMKHFKGTISTLNEKFKKNKNHDPYLSHIFKTNKYELNL